MTTLQTLENFEGAIARGQRVRTIQGVMKPRSFELLKYGDAEVSISMKQSMHSPTCSGLGAESPGGSFVLFS